MSLRMEAWLAPVLTNSSAYNYRRALGEKLGCWAEATLLEPRGGATYQRPVVFRVGYQIRPTRTGYALHIFTFTCDHDWCL